MKKIIALSMLCVLCVALYGCAHCEQEPIVKENHALIVPPNFGNKPAK
ncbi:MAG: hypothetical protein FWC51_00620 [Proteobacteria bacterium]|nr:hypothetical protein [Pseudomonadota bacterium]